MLVTNTYFSPDKTQLQLTIELVVNEKEIGKGRNEILPIDGRYKAMAKALLEKENIVGEWKCVDVRAGLVDRVDYKYYREYQFSYCQKDDKNGK